VRDVLPIFRQVAPHPEGAIVNGVIIRYLAALDAYQHERQHRHPSQHLIKETRIALEAAEGELRAIVETT
jgi:hypothetical protein